MSISCSLAVLSFLAQDFDQPIRDWKWQVYERNGRGQLALIAELTADRAIQRDVKKKIFDMENLRLLYYSRPRTPQERPQRLDFRSPEGTYDDSRKLVILHRDVHGRGEDGSTLRGRKILLDMEKKTLHTDEPFTLHQPDLDVKGTGMEGDDRLGKMIIRKEARAVARSKTSQSTTLSSTGPMTIVRGKDRSGKTPETTITTEGGTVILLGEGRETTRVECAASTILLAKDPRSGEFELRRAVLDGKPTVRVVQGETKIEASRGVIDRELGLTRFTGGADARLLPKGNGTPFRVKSRDLVQHEERVGDRRQPVRVEADGDVTVVSLAKEKDQALTARCGRFRWDLKREAGVFYGAPWVRIRMNETRILAAKVLMPAQDVLILQGPKRILLQTAPGETSAVRSGGDLLVDRSSGRIKMVDRSSVFSKDLHLTADRIRARLDEKGRGLQSLRGQGRVRLRRTSDHTLLFGDQMERTGAISLLRGWPSVVFLQEGAQGALAEVRFDPERKRIDGFRGKKPIRILITEENRR